MKTQTAIDFYGSNVALTAALGLSSGAVSQWGEYPPNARQLQIEKLTLGALKAEPHCMDRLLGLTQTEKATETVAVGV